MTEAFGDLIGTIGELAYLGKEGGEKKTKKEGLEHQLKTELDLLNDEVVALKKRLEKKVDIAFSDEEKEKKKIQLVLQSIYDVLFIIALVIAILFIFSWYTSFYVIELFDPNTSGDIKSIVYQKSEWMIPEFVICPMSFLERAKVGDVDLWGVSDDAYYAYELWEYYTWRDFNSSIDYLVTYMGENTNTDRPRIRMEEEKFSLPISKHDLSHGDVTCYVTRLDQSDIQQRVDLLEEGKQIEFDIRLSVGIQWSSNLTYQSRDKYYPTFSFYVMNSQHKLERMGMSAAAFDSLPVEDKHKFYFSNQDQETLDYHDFDFYNLPYSQHEVRVVEERYKYLYERKEDRVTFDAEFIHIGQFSICDLGGGYICGYDSVLRLIMSDKIKIIEEVQERSWTDGFTNVGGIIGFMGALFFFGMVVIRWIGACIYKCAKKIKERKNGVSKKSGTPYHKLKDKLKGNDAIDNGTVELEIL